MTTAIVLCISLCSRAGTAYRAGIMAAGRCRRTEFRNREAHTVENIAGTGCTVTESAAVLIGNTVIRSLNHNAGRSLHSHNGEYSECDIKILCAGIIGKLAVNTVYNVFGKLVTTAAATSVIIIFFHNLHIKHHGSCRFKHNSGSVNSRFGIVCTFTEAACINIGCEHTYTAFAAVKHEVFVIYCDTTEFDSSAAGDTCFKCNSEIITDTYRIISSVKSNLTYGYARSEYLCAFCSDIICSFNRILSCYRQVNLYVFKTLFHWFYIRLDYL